MQYFAENVGKPLVFLGFCVQSARKPYKTCAFCYILLKILKNHWFSLVFWAPIAKKPYKTCAFLHFVHRNTYRNTPENGREGDAPGQLVTAQVKTPKCKHCLGNILYTCILYVYIYILSSSLKNRLSN